MPYTILVVDDDQGCVNVLERYLDGLDHDIVTATSGEEALERLKTSQFDVILLDIAMPDGMDGIETLKQVLENHPRTKVIMVSGLVDQDQSFEAALALGAHACVRKPYDLVDVAVAIT